MLVCNNFISAIVGVVRLSKWKDWEKDKNLSPERRGREKYQKKTLLRDVSG